MQMIFEFKHFYVTKMSPTKIVTHENEYFQGAIVCKESYVSIILSVMCHFNALLYKNSKVVAHDT